MERARTVKIEIKPAGYGRVRFIGIDIELPYGNYTQNISNLPTSKTERAK